MRVSSSTRFFVVVCAGLSRDFVSAEEIPNAISNYTLMAHVFVYNQSPLSKKSGLLLLGDRRDLCYNKEQLVDDLQSIVP